MNFEEALATAVLGVDTLWGGDVMDPSGTGRFIADSWFSDEPLPPAYTHESAVRLRQCGGVGGKEPDRPAVRDYLAAVDVLGAIDGVIAEGRRLGGLRGAYLGGMGECFRVMWDLAQEQLGQGEHVPYERCMRTLLGAVPGPSDPTD